MLVTMLTTIVWGIIYLSRPSHRLVSNKTCVFIQHSKGKKEEHVEVLSVQKKTV